MVGLWIASLPPADEPVRVEQIQHAKWSGCWRISDGRLEVVVVPAIGRIMRLGRPGGPNVLWENLDLCNGRTIAKPGEWANYGGDKLWPSPQTWGWPPDPKLDGGMHRSRAIPGGVWMASQSAASAGVRFEREIILLGGRDEVVLRNRMTCIGPQPVEWAIWQVAQLDEPDEVWMDLPSAQAEPIRMGDPPAMPIDAFVDRRGATLRIRRSPQQSFKFGSGAIGGSLWAKTRAGWFEMRPVLEPPLGTFPDQGAGLQVYSNSDPDRYVELEATGFARRLRPGESTSFEVRWRLRTDGPH